MNLNLQMAAIRDYLDILKATTIQDCLDMYEMKGKSTIIKDGKIIGFQKAKPHTDR